MQQTELSEQFQEILRNSNRRVQLINYVLAVLLIIVLIWAMFATWRNSLQEKIQSIQLDKSSIKILGPTALCPGETMTIRFVLDIEGTGAVIIDDTVKYAERTVIFSKSLRDYLPDDSKAVYEVAWPIPETPDTAINGQRQWMPGMYRRYISVAASNIYVSRYTDPASFWVPFTMKPLSECE